MDPRATRSALERREPPPHQRMLEEMIEIKSSSEEKSARIERQKQRAVDEVEEARSERAVKMARLRTLRLVKEASEKRAANQKTNGTPATAKTPRRLPQAHRRG